jgi:hypothetical protein
MERDYDIFEILPDGSPMWREAIHGHEAAIRKMKELAARSPNAFELMYLPDRTVIATMKGQSEKPTKPE